MPSWWGPWRRRCGVAEVLDILRALSRSLMLTKRERDAVRYALAFLEEEVEPTNSILL